MRKLIFIILIALLVTVGCMLFNSLSNMMDRYNDYFSQITAEVYMD